MWNPIQAFADSTMCSLNRKYLQIFKSLTDGFHGTNYPAYFVLGEILLAVKVVFVIHKQVFLIAGQEYEMENRMEA